MGLVLLLYAAGAFVFIGGPSFVIGLAIVTRSQRIRGFWSMCIATSAVSFLGQYTYSLAPFTFLRTREYSWELIFNPLLGWHLAAPPVLAVVVWVVSRRVPLRLANSIIAGLLFSLTAVIVLAIPLAVTLPGLLGIHFRP